MKYFNLLKPNGNLRTAYFNNQQLCILATECIYQFRMILRINIAYFLNINWLIFVMVVCCVSFVIGTELLNNS
jgi:hypothetical protein